MIRHTIRHTIDESSEAREREESLRAAIPLVRRALERDESATEARLLADIVQLRRALARDEETITRLRDALRLIETLEPTHLSHSQDLVVQVDTMRRMARHARQG